MQYKAFMIKYAEIGTKGKNRYIFEDILCKNINRKLKNYGDFYIRKEQGRIFVECKSDYDYEDVVGALGKVFGIVGICPVVVEENTEFENLKQKVIDYVDRAYDHKNFTFKVFTRRNEKSYPMTSMEVSAELGHFLLEAYPGLSVDVHSPQEIINVEKGCIYIFHNDTWTGRASCRNKWKGNGTPIRRYRQPGCCIHDSEERGCG